MGGARQSRILLIITLAAATVVLVQLFPFDFQTRCTTCTNGVRIEQDAAGFVFEGEGIIRDPEVGPILSQRLASADGVTVGLFVRSNALFQQGPARIVTLSSGPAARNLTVGQQRDRVVLRLRTPGTGPNGSAPDISAPLALLPGQERLVFATYDGTGFRIYVDGVLRAERLLSAGSLSGWDPNFELAFGNEMTGDRPWRGALRDVVLYDRALSGTEIASVNREAPRDWPVGAIYQLSRRCPVGQSLTTDTGLRIGHCFMPATYTNAHVWSVLGGGRRQVADYAMAFCLWAPLGVLVASATSGVAARVVTVLALAAVALLAEWGQAPLFSRTSSLHDLVSSWAGLAAGLALGLNRHAPKAYA